MNKRESVLNTDKFDRRRFGQILDMSDRLQELEQKGKEVFPTFSPLMSDMWASLYKMKPSLLEEGEFDEEYQAKPQYHGQGNERRRIYTSKKYNSIG